MSSNLHWRTPNPEGKSFGYALKFPLREYCANGIIAEWTSFDSGDVPFLRGLIAGAGEGSDAGREAKFLIEKIERHGSVEVREVF